MSDITRGVELLASLVGNTASDVQALSSGGIQLFGVATEDGIILEGVEETLLPYPVVSMVDYSWGDRLSLTLVGNRPVITGRVGGADPTTEWEINQGIENLGDELVAANELLVNHESKIEQAEQLVDDIKQGLDKTDALVAGMGEKVDKASTNAVTALENADNAIHVANLSKELAEGLVSFEADPPENPPVGQVWVSRNSEGDATGLWRWNGEDWEVVTNLVGLLVVPTEDGGQTLIGKDGIEATKIVAEVLRTDLLYFDDGAGRTLVITDIPRENLAEDVGEALSTAEELGSRIVLDGAKGTLTIARNRRNSSDPVTAVSLSATSLDFIVDDRLIAYIDSEFEQMSIANALITDTLQVGSHQVRTIPGSGITTFMRVEGV